LLTGTIHETPTVVFPLLAITPVGLPGTPVVVALLVAATETPTAVSDVMEIV
jgi:hypothetical protein